MKQHTLITALLGVTLLALPLPVQAADLAYMSKLTGIEVQPQIPGTTVTLALRGAVKPVVTALDRAVQVELKGTYLTPAKQRIPVGTGGIAEVFAYQYDKDTVRVRLLPTKGSDKALFKRLRVENEAGVMRLMVVGTPTAPVVAKASAPKVKTVERPALMAVATPDPAVTPTATAPAESAVAPVNEQPTVAAATPAATPVDTASAIAAGVAPTSAVETPTVDEVEAAVPAKKIEATPIEATPVVEAAIEPPASRAIVDVPNMKALIQAREDALAALAKLVGPSIDSDLAQGGGSPALPALAELAALEHPEGPALISDTSEAATDAANDEVIVTAMADVTTSTVAETPAEAVVETVAIAATSVPEAQATEAVAPASEQATPAEPVSTEANEADTTPLVGVVKAPSLWQSGAKMVAGLAIVLALLYGGLALLRRFKGMPIGGRVPIRVLGTAAVGARQNIVVVDVDGRRLVVGVGPNGMAKLGDLGAGNDPDQITAPPESDSAADEVASKTPQPPPSSPFSKALQEADDEQAGEAIARASRNLQRHLKLLQSRNV